MSTREEDVSNWRFWLLFGGALVLLVNLSKGVWELSSVRQRVEEVEERVQGLTEENKELRSELSWVESENFTEQEIRDRLRMSQSGDVVLVLPDVPETKLEVGSVEDGGGWETPWRRWMELFW